MHDPAPASDDSDLALRIAAPRGDAAAEAELRRCLRPYRRMRGATAAADLVQDVLLMTLQKLRAGALRESGKLASFILGTCRQMVIDGRRGGHRRERILETYAADLEPAEEADQSLDIERLQLCLARLAERERSVLVMTFYGDQPADEVGTALGLTPANVRVIRHRGIEKLRLCIDSKESA